MRKYIAWLLFTFSAVNCVQLGAHYAVADSVDFTTGPNIMKWLIVSGAFFSWHNFLSLHPPKA